MIGRCDDERIRINHEIASQIAMRRLGWLSLLHTLGKTAARREGLPMPAILHPDRSAAVNVVRDTFRMKKLWVNDIKRTINHQFPIDLENKRLFEKNYGLTK